MMASTAFLVVVVLFWLLVYLQQWNVRSESGANNSLLPFTVASPRASQTLMKLGHYLDVEIPSRFILRGRTTAFVDSHARLLGFLKQTPPSHLGRRRARITQYWGKTLKIFYSIGSVTAILGQIFAVGGLWWSLLQLVLHLLSGSAPNHVVTQTLTKRSPISTSQLSPPRELLLRPLIPGVTLPLSHLFTIMVSLIVCTTIHEMGHAIAAAADGVPLISWGYSLILLIPAAFVELAVPSAAQKEGAPSFRLRISSAGAYHNLITLLVLMIGSTLSLDRIIWPVVGYRDMERGLVVVNVDQNSPLGPHLISGSIITRVDDVILAKSSNHSTHDLWSSLLLTDPVVQEFWEGWCVGREWFDDHSQSCCPGSATHNKQDEAVSCFIPHTFSLTTRDYGRCLDPVPLFEDRTGQRCISDTTCNSSRGHDNSSADPAVVKNNQAQICIIPHLSAKLLRITFTEAFGDPNEKIITWRGPRREVWEQVTVGKYLPRTRVLPLTLPSKLELLLEYLRTISLSLFLFNLLPVRFLDGGEILNASLGLVLMVGLPWENNNRDVDIEMGLREWDVRPSLPTWRRLQKFEVAIETMTIVLVGVVFVGGLFTIGVG